MRQVLTRRWYVVLFTLLVAPLAAASVAAACTALATFEVNPQSAPAGEVISGTGKGFRASHGGPADELASPVQIRFDSRSGPVLWSGNPDASGTIGFSLTVPDAAAGDYTLIATQDGADGKPVYGTPARQSLTISRAATRASFDQQSTAAVPASEEPAAPVAAPAPAPVVAPAPVAPATAVAPEPAATSTAAAVPATPSPASALDAGAAPASVAPAPASVAPAPAATPESVSAAAPAAGLSQPTPAAPAADASRAATVDVGATVPASSDTATSSGAASSLLDPSVLLLLGVGLALISLGFMWRQPKVAELR